MAAILSSCCWMRSCRGFLGPASSISTSAAIQRLTTPLSRHGPLFSTASKKEAEAPSDVVVAEALTYSMEDVVGLCKRRGIIFPSSEIYNGYAGFYDYGPLGSELKKNVKDAWWKNFVMMREDVVGVDSSIIHNPETWKSSGHVDGFSDPMVDCKETKLRYRADQLFYAPVMVSGEAEVLGYLCVQEANEADMAKEAKKQAKALLKSLDRKGETVQEPFDFREVVEATETEMAQIPSPGSGKPTLTMPRAFNLMFQTQVGALSDAASVAYLRPETAQGIFLNFKNVLTTSRQKIPFGIAQIGKAFRNEITPRNFIFRSREFEQMEVEYFIPPGDEVWPAFHQQWIDDSRAFLLSIGLQEELLGWDVHEGDKLAHYAQACTDITFRFPFGEQELMGIAARGNYDLSQHSEGSGKSLEYYDEQTKEKYIPHCIEPSLGVDRLMLALICSAYAEDEVGGEKRSLLKFDPKIAPIKVAVLPLLKNKEELVSVARDLFDKLRRRWNCQYDAAGAIGRRYRRADEVGTPYCITIDFDTIETDNAVTIRDRDTTDQVRIPLKDVISYLSERIDGY
jgi:glycyl-tRNA synthetase